MLGALTALTLAGCSDSSSALLSDSGSDGSGQAPLSTTEPGPTGTEGEPTGTDDSTGGDESTGEDESTGGEPSPPPADDGPEPEAWVWTLPPGFPVPYVPEDNPMSTAKVELGRHLFYDERLSVDGTTSCATCHIQEFAFTDGLPQGVGATGEHHPRGSMSLANIAYASTLGWGNPHKDFRLTEFELTAEQLADALALFESLTDEQFLTNPAFADPWE